MNEIHSTEEFNKWLSGLADFTARAKILVRIDRAKLGNFGDAESVGDSIFEMRIDFGPGYRVYYVRDGRIVYILLNGGDKSTQKTDIKNAKKLWKEIQKEQS
ncbi:MAG: type II toxin-antitoxin system RelE/ParE family toxin [Pseudomonadota bacterium]